MARAPPWPWRVFALRSGALTPAMGCAALRAGYAVSLAALALDFTKPQMPSHGLCALHSDGLQRATHPTY